MSRRSQAERRADTRQKVLDSACLLFAERGYNETSLADIAAHCGLTTRPVYHYFGNKETLFAAVNEAMEARILNMLIEDEEADLSDRWKAFLALCDDPGFRRVVLIDAPVVLGRERWFDGQVSQLAWSQFQKRPGTEQDYRRQLSQRMLMSAFKEAAMVIAEAEDPGRAKEEANTLVQSLIDMLWSDNK